MPPESTETLVFRAQQGDSQAFSALVAHWTGPVHCIALARTTDPGTAEDLVQVTFLQAWRKIGHLREPAAFGSWVRRIARSTCRDHARRLSARPRESPVSALPVPAPPSDSPEHRVLTLEVRRALHAILLALPEGDRELVLLYHLEGCSTADLATQLGLTEPAVRKRLSRARQSLSASLSTALATWLGQVTLGPPFRAELMTQLPGAPGMGPLLSPPILAASVAAVLLAAGSLLVVTTGSSWGSEPEPTQSALVLPSVSMPATAVTRPAPASGIGRDAAPAPAPAVLAADIPTLAESIRAVFDTLQGHPSRWSQLTVDCREPDDTCDIWFDVVDRSAVPALMLRVSQGLESQGIYTEQFRPLPSSLVEGNDAFRVGLFVSLSTMLDEPPPEPPEPDGTLVQDRTEVEAFIEDWMWAVPDATDVRVDCSGPPGTCTVEVVVPEAVSDSELLAIYRRLSSEGYRVVGRAIPSTDGAMVPDGMRRHSMALTVLEGDAP